MYISNKVWQDYIERLRRINDKAGSEMFSYLAQHDWALNNKTKQAAIDYAFALATKYGEAASAAACEMYDSIAYEFAKNFVPSEPAPTATYRETAKSVLGTMKSNNEQQIANSVGRLVKMAGVDTMMQNALRDGAEWAWIPSGDSCAFCLALASRGWQKASKKAIKNGHAEHIHANCDCTYAVRFDHDTDVEGYDPEALYEQYANAEGDTWQEKMNSLRRAHYATNKDKINAQKRVAYYNRKNRNKQLLRITQVRASLISERIESGEYSLRLTNQQYQKHIRGTKQYNQYEKDRKKKGLGPQGVLSISQEETQKIIEKMSGTGIIKTRKDGSPMNIEWINVGKIVGEYCHKGKWYPTTKAAIHHGSHGSHLVPIKGNNYD